jgi:heterodisulfide reductase subunit A
MAQSNETKSVDVLIVGGGIAGLQTALDLADQDLSVLIVEREASIGGRMISLSKVFPTLDCASCITTPKMSAAAHHPNVEIWTSTVVDRIEPRDPGQAVDLTRQPTYVDNDACIGCRLCEYACDVEYPDPFEDGLGSLRAIAIPHTNAIPQKAVLNPDYCIGCGQCARVCPTNAIRYDQEPLSLTVDAGAVVLATGYKLNDLSIKPQYSAAQSKNILSPLTMERLLAPHGPYGRVLRPSDGKIPDNIAYVQCAGSRDLSIGVPYCSRVCCMYAIKQAMLLSGALPLADITIYYMDIRAFGKGYEQFYQNAKVMGINFVRGKVARISPVEGDNLELRVELMEEGAGSVENRRHDVIVLSQGMLPAWDPAAHSSVELAEDRFVRTPSLISPTETNVAGIFVAGTAAGPKDIPDTIVEAGNTAMEVSQFLHERRHAAISAA